MDSDGYYYKPLRQRFEIILSGRFFMNPLYRDSILYRHFEKGNVFVHLFVSRKISMLRIYIEDPAYKGVRW